jgi:hypothetical protein
MARPVGNIGERGCRRRRGSGYVWLAVAAVGVILNVTTNGSRTALLALSIPIWLAALGFLQAKEQTCVVHALAGTRETDNGVTRLDPRDLPEVRRRAWRVGVLSVVIAVVVTAVIYVLAGRR